MCRQASKTRAHYVINPSSRPTFSGCFLSASLEGGVVEDLLGQQLHLRFSSSIAQRLAPLLEGDGLLF
jgi:hypothetical protein